MDWNEEGEHRIKTLRVGTATVIIRRPKLSGEEYRRREMMAKSALESYARGIVKNVQK